MTLKSDAKFEKKTDLLLQNWPEFSENWLEHSKFLKSCTLIGSFCAKDITFDLKKYREVIFHDMKNLADFIRALASLKIGTLMGSFYPKQKMYEPKIYRGVIYHGNEEWWHEEFWDDQLEEFWPEFPKISKICTLKNGTISKTFHTYSTE